MKVNVAGVPFDDLTESEVVDRVFDHVADEVGGQIVTPNIDVLRQLKQQTEGEIITDSTLVVPDGMPIVWASKIMRTPLPERVTGASLVWSLAERAAQRGESVFYLGGAPGVAQQAADEMSRRYPRLKVAGVHCPPFGFENDPGAVEEVRDAIADANPRLVFIALGHPKQDRLGRSLLRAFPDTWFLGCGGALTMAASVVPRAPAWMGRCGVEWMHRFAHEPRRLFVRYFVHDTPFALRVLGTAVAHRLGLGSSAAPASTPRATPTVMEEWSARRVRSVEDTQPLARIPNPRSGSRTSA